MARSAGDQLLDAALDVPFHGWDFSLLGDRILIEPPPWSFETIVDLEATVASSMLDMGTGGGEWLSARRHAPTTVATESWPPNVPLAANRLQVGHVPVVHDEGAVDNPEQTTVGDRGRLPFRDGAFDLVVNRHEAFVAAEVRRVLEGGGAFVTQQASSGTQQFHDLLGVPPTELNEFHLERAVAQLEQAGLIVDRAAKGTATTVFADIGALAWYLTNVPWALPGFSIAPFRARLLGLHGRAVRVPSERFWLRAHA